MNETEKKKIKMWIRHQRLLKKILDHNTDAQKIFQHASKVNKGKSKPKPKESIAERVKLRRQKLDIIKKKKESINNGLFSHCFDYLNPVIMFERLRETIDEKNKDLVESVNKKLTKMKNIVKNVPKDILSRVEDNEKIINIVERNLELIAKKILRRLKILTLKQMLNRLPISLAQLNAGNNSEKLKNEIIQLLYSLYRSKKLTN